MQIDDSRPIRVAVAVRDDLTAYVVHLMPRVAGRAETAALYLFVCAFWGLVLYVALTSALR